jgi:hypothetical protein
MYVGHVAPGISIAAGITLRRLPFAARFPLRTRAYHLTHRQPRAMRAWFSRIVMMQSAAALFS